jgi:hypothetical protein
MGSAGREIYRETRRVGRGIYRETRKKVFGFLLAYIAGIYRETRKKAFGFLLAYMAAEDSTSHQWQAAARLLSAELLLQVKSLDMSFRARACSH